MVMPTARSWRGCRAGLPSLLYRIMPLSIFVNPEDERRCTVVRKPMYADPRSHKYLGRSYIAVFAPTFKIVPTRCLAVQQQHATNVIKQGDWSPERLLRPRRQTAIRVDASAAVRQQRRTLKGVERADASCRGPRSKAVRPWTKSGRLFWLSMIIPSIRGISRFDRPF